MAAHHIAPVIVFIYGLIDPRDGQLRYVGRTKRKLSVRLSGHIQGAKKAADRHVHSWIRGLLIDGLKPEIVALERADESTWIEAEQFWIGYFRWLGADLTNLADGGKGTLGFRHSDEQRAKWRRERCGENHPWYGKKRSPEEVAEMSARLRRMIAERGPLHAGHVHTTETRQKIAEGRAKNPPKLSDAGREAQRAATVERWKDPAWRDRFKKLMSGPGNPLYGIPMTPEKRAQMIKNGPDNPRYGKTHTEETKAKMRAAARGRVCSDETRRRMSEAAKRRWTKPDDGSSDG